MKPEITVILMKAFGYEYRYIRRFLEATVFNPELVSEGIEIRTDDEDKWRPVLITGPTNSYTQEMLKKMADRLLGILDVDQTTDLTFTECCIIASQLVDPGAFILILREGWGFERQPIQLPAIGWQTPPTLHDMAQRDWMLVEIPR